MSVISLISATCSGQPNALAHLPVSCPTLLPPTNIQEHLCAERFPLPPPAYSLAKHVPISSYYQLIILIKHQKKKDFLEEIAVNAISSPSDLPNYPPTFLTHLYITHKMKTPKTQ